MKQKKAGTYIQWGVALAVSCVSTVFSIFVMPTLFTQGGGWVSLVAGVLGLVVLLLTSLLLQSLHRTTTGQRGRSFGAVVLGVFVLFGLLAVCAVIVSVLYGLFAMAVQALLAASLGLQTVKSIVSIATGVFTVLLMPFWVNILFGYGYAEEGVWAGIKVGLRGIRKRYWKLALILLGSFGLGYLLAWLFLLGNGSYLASAAKGLLLCVLGATGLMLCARVCAPKWKEV